MRFPLPLSWLPGPELDELLRVPTDRRLWAVQSALEKVPYCTVYCTELNCTELYRAALLCVLFYSIFIYLSPIVIYSF